MSISSMFISGIVVALVWLSFSNEWEVLGFLGFHFSGFFWNTIVSDDWVVEGSAVWSVVLGRCWSIVRWSSMISRCWSIMSWGSMSLGVSNESQMSLFCVGNFCGVLRNAIDWGRCRLVSVLVVTVVDWSIMSWGGVVMSQLWVVEDGVCWQSLEGTLVSSEVDLLLVLNLRCVNWSDWAFVVMVKTSLGLSDGSKVSVFSGKNFVSLLDWQWSTVVIWGISRNIPVWVNWSGDGMDWWRSLWQVGGGNDLESVVWVGNVFHWLNMSVSINIWVSAVERSVMWLGFVFCAEWIGISITVKIIWIY
jgi:hypothetical protein